jgi:hypothetical protein
MDPIAVDVRLIRAVLGAELKIAPGRAMMARVVAADGKGRGSLSIAGAILDAELPKELQAGQELRLTVRHVSPERVELSMSDPTASPPPPAAAALLPGGGSVQVSERDTGGRSAGRSGPDSDHHSLALRYDAPTLGPIDLRFELDPSSLRLTATLAAGEPVERARGAAGELRDALSDALGRPVSVEVGDRREPLDVYA